MWNRPGLVPCQAPPPLPSRLDNYDKIDTQSPLWRDRGDPIWDASRPPRCTHSALELAVYAIILFKVLLVAQMLIYSDKNTLNPPASHTLNCQNVHFANSEN